MPTDLSRIWPVEKVITDGERVAPADLPAVEARLLGELVEHALHREVPTGWRRSRASRRTSGCWSPRRSPRCRRSVTRYGPQPWPGGALEHLGADRGVAPGVADHVGLDRGQPPVGVAADLVVHLDAVALRVDADRLLAGQDVIFTGRPVRYARSAVWAWTHMSSLPPKAPPLGTSSTFDLRPRGQAEERRALAAIVEDALALRVELDAARRPRARRARSRARGSRARCAASGTRCR
jgi:hypothetical protein